MENEIGEGIVYNKLKVSGLISFFACLVWPDHARSGVFICVVEKTAVRDKNAGRL